MFVKTEDSEQKILTVTVSLRCDVIFAVRADMSMS